MASKGDDEFFIHEFQMKLIEEFESNFLQEQGITYIAEYDWEADNGSYYVTDGTKLHATGLTESQATKVAEALNADESK